MTAMSKDTGVPVDAAFDEWETLSYAVTSLGLSWCYEDIFDKDLYKSIKTWCPVASSFIFSTGSRFGHCEHHFTEVFCVRGKKARKIRYANDDNEIVTLIRVDKNAQQKGEE